MKNLKVAKKYYLNGSLIKEKSVVMIDFENSKRSKPFYVDSKTKQKEGITILYGNTLINLINKKIEGNHFYRNRLYTRNSNKDIKIKNPGILGFRKLTQEEKIKLIDKIRLIPTLNDFIEIIQDS